MAHAVTLIRTLLLMGLLTGWAAAQQPGTSVTQANDPLVQDFEALYAQSMQAARKGDLDAYWSTRTAAARKRPPTLDATRLQLLASLLPPLDTLQFVRLDSSGKVARVLYRWRKNEVEQYSVLVFRVEQGEWKLDDFTVRRSAVNVAGPGAAARMLPAPSDAPSPSIAMDAQAQDLLRAWENTAPDPGRRLTEPRL